MPDRVTARNETTQRAQWPIVCGPSLGGPVELSERKKRVGQAFKIVIPQSKQVNAEEQRWAVGTQNCRSHNILYGPDVWANPKMATHEIKNFGSSRHSKNLKKKVLKN